VAYLFDGIGLPSGARTYTVTTNGGGVLPSIIPAGAGIIAHGAIKDAENHILTVNGILTANDPGSTFEDIVTLTVNGELYVDYASLEDVETLTVSSLNNDTLTSPRVLPIDRLLDQLNTPGGQGNLGEGKKHHHW
jgi:hypothetical protein